MNENKQIEEMEKTMCAFYGTETCYDCRYCCDCHIHHEAERFCNAGFRKASEVAKEIFEDIEREIKNHGITYAQRKIAELKMKYTEGKG